MMHGTRYKNINCYELLGITPDSSIQEIKSAFRTVSMKTHPDVGGSNESQARVNYAYETLTDPIRRRLHDDFLISIHRYNQEVFQQKFETAKDLKNSFIKTKAKKNIVDRVKKEVKRQADEIRSCHNNRYEKIFMNNRDAFKKTRRVCITSISGVILSIIFGFLYPIIWLGILLSGYFLVTNLKYRKGGAAIFVFDSYWDIYVKKISKNQAKVETDTLIARLNEKIENIIKFVSIAKNASSKKDREEQIALRIIICLFISGYVPFSHERARRMVVLSDEKEKIALGYRHRAGKPANAAYVKNFFDYMSRNEIKKGFIFTSPGLSKNASSFADKNGIAHYSMKELNVWIDQTMSGKYDGPKGNILDHIDALINFIQGMPPHAERRHDGEYYH